MDRHVDTTTDRLLGLTDRNRRIAGDMPDRLQRCFHEIVGVDNLVDEAPALGVLSRERLAGQNDLAGAPGADRPRQVLRSAGTGMIPSVTSVNAKRA